MEQFIKQFNYLLTLFCVFPAMILVGCYLTARLRFIQISQLKTGFKHLLFKDVKEEGSISHFEAIAAVLAGNFGTGNISGMAVALTSGGPGALVWMWIMAFLGAAIQYTSCVLAVKYREKNCDGEFVGGPMYYLKQGLGLNKCAFLFACFTLFAAVTVGNFAQINSVTLPLKAMGLDPLVCALVITVFVGLVMVGGIQRLAGFASYIVPFKAVLYLGAASVIILLHFDKVGSAFHLMFSQAFDFHSISGGMLGYGVFKAITTGFDRGIFATDAGTGIVPILQASAKTKHPVIDGVVTLVAPFMVMIVCTATGLVLLVTGAWQTSLQSTNMVTHAFAIGLNTPVGAYIVLVALILFAYTTILAWGYCGEKALAFIAGPKAGRAFRYFYIALIPVGAFINVQFVWSLADLAIGLMLLTNMVGIVGLSGQVVKDSREFLAA